jgi:hypothetical protein
MTLITKVKVENLHKPSTFNAFIGCLLCQARLAS